MGEQGITPAGVVRVRSIHLAGALLIGVAAANAGNLFYATVHGLGRGGRLYAWFALGAEGGLPTWFSTVLLLLAAVMCGLVALEAHFAGRAFLWHWAGLAAVFAFLSADEAAQIHEGLGSVVAEHVDVPRALTAAGVIPGLVLAGLVAFVYARFLAAQRREVQLGLVLAGAAYVAGAAGVEAFAQAVNAGHHLGRLSFFLLDTLEENLEMLGIVAFVVLVARHLEGLGTSLTVSFGCSRKASPAEHKASAGTGVTVAPTP